MSILAHAVRLFAGSLLAGISLWASPALGLTFAFEGSFDVANFGASAGGTPRGLAVTDDGLLVNDSLDDQILRLTANPASPVLTATYETDPFVCSAGSVPVDCTPAQDWARVAWDVAWDGSSIWLVDKEAINDSTTWLIEVSADGEFVQRLDADSAGADPGGLSHDPRSGGLVLSDRGNDLVTHFDATGSPTGASFLGAFAGNATGIAHFDGDLFLITDASDDTVYEAQLPSGNGFGSATLIGETIFQGFDVSTLLDLQSVDYDAATETLYLLDASSDRVYVFTLVPEPSSAMLLALGLALLGRRRRRSV